MEAGLPRLHRASLRTVLTRAGWWLRCSYRLVAFFASQDDPVSHTLDLSWNRMGKRGAKSLATTLRSVRHLRNLDLAWTLFGDTGLDLLERGLAVNQSLHKLNLAGCKLSANAGMYVLWAGRLVEGALLPLLLLKQRSAAQRSGSSACSKHHTARPELGL